MYTLPGPGARALDIGGLTISKHLRGECALTNVQVCHRKRSRTCDVYQLHETGGGRILRCQRRLALAVAVLVQELPKIAAKVRSPHTQHKADGVHEVAFA